MPTRRIATIPISLLCAIALGLSLSVNASASEEPADIYLVGKLGDKLDVQMSLRVDGKKITGSYYYERYGTPIPLVGTLRDGKAQLDEHKPGVDVHGKVLGEETARLTLDWPSPHAKRPAAITGSWQSVSSSRSLSLKLRWVAESAMTKQSAARRFSVEVFMPYLMPNATRDERELKLARLVNRRVDQISQRWVHTYREDLAVIRDASREELGGYSYRYSYSDRVVLAYHATDLLSMEHRHWEYTGGAHGNYYTTGINLQHDGKGLRELAIEDLLKTDQATRVKLGKLCDAYLKKHYAYRGEVASVAKHEAQVKTAKQSLLRHVTFNAAAITFHFPPYAIASYAQGGFAASIPLADIADQLHADSPLHRFVK